MENNGIISRFNKDILSQEEERVITPVYRDDDDQENKLRPKMLKDYVGQEKVKHNLDVYMHAAKRRGDALDHVLLYGPPGLGKTTLAHVIANEMGAQVKVTSGPAIEKALDLSAMLTKLEKVFHELFQCLSKRLIGCQTSVNFLNHFIFSLNLFADDL